jgi:hypothetical protein
MGEFFWFILGRGGPTRTDLLLFYAQEICIYANFRPRDSTPPQNYLANVIDWIFIFVMNWSLELN